MKLLLVKATALAATAVLVAACGGQVSHSPTPDLRVGEVLQKLDRLADSVERVEQRLNSVTPLPPASLATPRLGATSELRPTFAPGAGPTPHPANSFWVQQRLNAVITLYDLTDAGSVLIRSLDLRQMEGDPGFFGSYGFIEWAGVGEAKPIGVIHELSHSYWGGFPIAGLPQLSWNISPGSSLSPAMQRYHADILTFMAQPPDSFELLRQRLRNLPDLSASNAEPLVHSVEADLVYNTGGNLALVPPILRKYWSQFLKDGPFASWYDAVAWYRSLPEQDRTSANKYLGFEHLDLREYGSLLPSAGQTELINGRRGTLEQEEKQRLFDLADQFDLLLGDPQRQENFQFWRGYLRDKATLFRRHEGYLASLELPRAADLDSALGFMDSLIGSSPEEQARRLAEQLPMQPFLVNFLPTLENRTLLRLFTSGDQLPEGATLRATASFVDRLKRFSVLVQAVLAAGRDDPQQGASELQEFLSGVDFAQKEDLRLLFELLREQDPATASRVIQALDIDTFRRLMLPVPAQLRFMLTAAELLDLLDITAESDVPDLQRGVTILVEEPSGNYIIDEPFLNRMYEVIASRSRAEIQDMLGLLQQTPVSLEGFIRQQPQAAATLLASDLKAAAALLLESDPVLAPPARIVYRLVFADPTLAAQLVQALDQRGEAALVVESLAYLAYDKARSDRVPGLPISLEQDGKFLRAVLSQQGAAGLTRRLNDAFSVFEERASTAQVPMDFLDQLHTTLKAAAATVPEALDREELQQIIEEVAEEYALQQ